MVVNTLSKEMEELTRSLYEIVKSYPPSELEKLPKRREVLDAYAYQLVTKVVLKNNNYETMSASYFDIIDNSPHHKKEVELYEWFVEKKEVGKIRLLAEKKFIGYKLKMEIDDYANNNYSKMGKRVWREKGIINTVKEVFGSWF